jgi:hypothetical protein
MGNLWKGISDQKLADAEKALLTHKNLLTEADILIENVNLDGRYNSQNFIHQVTIKPASEGLPKLVMIHGFGGGGAIFVKMIPYLREYF